MCHYYHRIVAILCHCSSLLVRPHLTKITGHTKFKAIAFKNECESNVNLLLDALSLSSSTEFSSLLLTDAGSLASSLSE